MATKKKPLDWQPAYRIGRLAPASESKDHIKISPQYEFFINGKWQKPKSCTRSTGSGEPYFDTINPEVHCDTGRRVGSSLLRSHEPPTCNHIA